jgi:hypothetical protein
MLIIVPAVECCSSNIYWCSSSNNSSSNNCSISVAEETENCMEKQSIVTKITALAAVAAIAIAVTAATVSFDAVKITLHLENCSFAK